MSANLDCSDPPIIGTIPDTRLTTRKIDRSLGRPIPEVDAEALLAERATKQIRR